MKRGIFIHKTTSYQKHKVSRHLPHYISDPLLLPLLEPALCDRSSKGTECIIYAVHIISLVRKRANLARRV